MTTRALPEPPEHRQSPRELLGFLEAHVGTRRAAALCAEVLGDDDPHDHAETVLFLGGAGGRDVLEGGTSWKPYWARVWGARGRLYVWDDSCAGVVLERLGDEAWRVAELCLKVAAKRELACGDDAVRLSAHDLPRVRAAAARTLGACGDTEHLDALLDLLGDPAEEVRRAAGLARERMARRLDV